MIELCPRMEEQFRFFERVTYQNIGAVSKENLLQQLEKENSALCIVNTKKRAQELYQLLEGEGVYHLSTSMYPKHRKRVLKQIRECLHENQKRCILISTSLVEAGVDLDFNCVYRQIAGIDSMIQAAGRCNREGLRDAADSKVYLFDFEDMKTVQGQAQQINTAKAILQDYENIAELTSIAEYFARLYHYRGASLDKKNIIGEFKHPDYNFAKVGKEFKLIEEDTKTIFINKEPEADEILRELKLQGVSRERIRKAGQYCIQVYSNFFDKLYGAGMVQPVLADMTDFYELTSLEQYTEECGLDYSVDDGEALFY